jgi:drug/metabolite transporter (DMT)-like permease
MEAVDLKTNKQALIKIGIGILLLGTGPMFVKFVKADGSLVAFYRLLFAGIMLALPAIIEKKDSSAGFTKREVIIWSVLGGVSLAINLALWCSALNYTTASMVTLLDNTAPVWVGLFSWLILRERQNQAYWIGLIMALSGSFLLIASGGSGVNNRQFFGNILGLVSGLSYAAYLLITQRTRQMMSSLKYTWLVSLVGAVFLLVFRLTSGFLQQVLPLKSYILIFIMSLSSQVVGWYFVNDALGKLPVTASSVALVGQPLVTTILGVLILHEIPSGVQIFGGLICLTGIIIVQKSFNQK